MSSTSLLLKSRKRQKIADAVGSVAKKRRVNVSKKKTTKFYMPPLVQKMAAVLGRGGMNPSEDVHEEHRFYALLAQSGYQKENEKETFLNTHIGDFAFRRDAESSSDEFDVYIPKNMEEHQRGFLVYRGTKTMEDVFKSDTHIALGTFKHSERYKKDLERTEKALEDLKSKGVHNVDLIGHSLGGTLAVDIGEAVKEKIGDGQVHAFNPGSGLGEAIKLKDDSHINRYHIQGDVVSTFSGRKLDHFYTQACGAKLAHSISNFTGVGLNCKNEETAVPMQQPDSVKESTKSGEQKEEEYKSIE